MQVNINENKLWFARGFIVLTAIAVWFFYFQSFTAKKEEHQQLSQKLSQQVKRFEQLNNLSLIAAEYEKRFQQYMPVKQFEEEKRLYWLDQLEQLRLKHRIPKLQYTFSQQQPYKYKDGLIKDKGIKVMYSDVKLTFGLVHAGDLMAIIRDLKKIQSTRHVITSCELKQSGRSGKNARRSTGSNIEGVCALKWFTFKVKA